MANKISSDLLMFRRKGGHVEFLLAHPGGPHHEHKQNHIWSIPKGQPMTGEDLLSAAKREFQEELGFEPRSDNFFELGSIKQKSGKTVYAWAFESDCDPSTVVSNTCEINWPKGSDTMITIPEIDKVGFFNYDNAVVKILPSQIPLLDTLVKQLKSV